MKFNNTYVKKTPEVLRKLISLGYKPNNIFNIENANIKYFYLDDGIIYTNLDTKTVNDFQELNEKKLLESKIQVKILPVKENDTIQIIEHEDIIVTYNSLMNFGFLFNSIYIDDIELTEWIKQINKNYPFNCYLLEGSHKNIQKYYHYCDYEMLAYNENLKTKYPIREEGVKLLGKLTKVDEF